MATIRQRSTQAARHIWPGCSISIISDEMTQLEFRIPVTDMIWFHFLKTVKQILGLERERVKDTIDNAMGAVDQPNPRDEARDHGSCCLDC